MYKEYFGFAELPFSIAPDPRYLYMSEPHREALAHLLYGVNHNGGFILLTGEVGTGKTTVCRCLLEQISPGIRVAYLINPKITAVELLAAVCDEFGISRKEGHESVKVLVDLINAYLLEVRARDGRAVLIIDEAQNLQPEVLEQLRLLTNLETSQEKLLQIVLLGQPELRAMLERPALRQLNQRITARYHLGPLQREDAGAYVNHRLKVAGLDGDLFTPPAIRMLYRLSGGIPRVMNVLADRALLGAYAQGESRVGARTLRKAAREVFGHEEHPFRVRTAFFWILTGAAIAGAAVLAAPLLQRTVPSVDEVPQAEKGPASVPAPPAPAPPVPEATPAETMRWLFAQTGPEGESQAWRDLFSLWNTAPPPDGSVAPCAQAETAGLKCYASQGSLNSLRRFNRPAVLKVADDEGRACYVTLAGLGDDKATLAANGEQKKMPLLWSGEYVLLWRPPPGYAGQVAPGGRSPIIPWLEERLAVSRGGSGPSQDALLYDRVLVEHVRDFQKSEGLDVDGIIGPETLIRLTAGDEDGLPRLSSSGGE